MVKLEMKKCKECGKMFMPTSNKQKYCTEDHYRPCPVCGKPVFAKYLSDPARCCSGICKSKLGKLNKLKDSIPAPGSAEAVEFEKNAIEEAHEAALEYAQNDAEAVREAYMSVLNKKDEKSALLAGTVKKKYVGPTERLDGVRFITDHEYAVIISHEDKQYIVSASWDYTDDKAVSLNYYFTNKKKISNVFRACK